MSDKPILFTGPMVRAILEGRKTQTRRLISIRGHQVITEFGPSNTAGYDWHFHDAKMLWHDLRHTELMPRLPYAIGDRLWVRETCATWNGFHRDTVYRADESNQEWELVKNDAKIGAWKIRSSIHMPRWASRLTLIVDDVRVERLQDISEADAVAEGIVHRRRQNIYEGADDKRGKKPTRLFTSPTPAFADLWDSINGPGAWASNPWVVALRFRAVNANIDQVEATP